MDRFTRNYSIVLVVISSVILVWALYEDPQVSELNDMLKKDQVVSDYPYRFYVRRFNHGVAVISTPRSTEFPVYKALGIIYPTLSNKSQNNPDLMQAQQKLAEVQKRVKKIVTGSEQVQRVRWELDREWLADHGIRP